MQSLALQLLARNPSPGAANTVTGAVRNISVPPLRFRDRFSVQERSGASYRTTRRAYGPSEGRDSRDMESDPSERKGADADVDMSAGQEKPQDGQRDDMSESFGAAYATRSSDDGFGAIYGEPAEGDSGVKPANCHVSQGRVPDGKSRHGTAAFPARDRPNASGTGGATT